MDSFVACSTSTTPALDRSLNDQVMANSTQRDASVERGRTTTVDSPSPNTSSTNHGNAMDNTLTISSEKTVVNEKHPGNPIATPGNAPSGDGLPHMLPSSQVAKSFKVDPTRGLDEATVKQLMQEHGPNILKVSGKSLSSTRAS